MARFFIYFLNSIKWNTTSLDSRFSLSAVKHTVTNDTIELYAVEQTLFIENANIDDNEDLICLAENSVGNVHSKIIVNVYCKYNQPYLSL